MIIISMYYIAKIKLNQCRKLPEWAIIKVENADMVQLEVWAEAIFDATSIEELF